MLTIPCLARMLWDFATKSNEEVQNNFSWTCYLFLLAIFVAMTNQASLCMKLARKNQKVFAQRLNFSIKITMMVVHLCVFFSITDTQVVPYIFRTTKVGSMAARSSHNFASSASPHSPRRSSRNIFLHHNRLVELASGKNTILAFPRMGHNIINWL